MAQASSLAPRDQLGRSILAVALIYTICIATVFPGSYWTSLSAYTVRRFLIAIPLLLLVGLISAAIVRSPRAPMMFLRRKLRTRLPGAAIIVIAFVFTAAAFTALKHEISLAVPFFADEILADLDQGLHGGDPWQLLRAFDSPTFDRIYYSLYSQLWFVWTIGLFLVVAFLDQAKLRNRYLASFLGIAVLLGGVVRTIGNSAGPIFYDRIFDSDRFAGLDAALASNSGGRLTLQITDYLWQAYATDTTLLGSGISAMPSLHVAFTCLNALFLASCRWWLGVIGWTYLAIIGFGSVYFGWHYAADAYVAIAGTLIIWSVAGRLARVQMMPPKLGETLVLATDRKTSITT
ncbi:phosphatase PAP2 family protein [Mesorhizobium sp. B2-8-9]|uniref:phosphatase PAP2 family protein n=1 Tax=Mesorhizobium sp. B2-8-9 TaxID=2589899 RepID=UPI0015E33FCA|nr:phosphatase PAP2 family protein [Mesorhizobium sp. B2-8-9]